MLKVVQRLCLFSLALALNTQATAHAWEGEPLCFNPAGDVAGDVAGGEIAGDIAASGAFTTRATEPVHSAMCGPVAQAQAEEPLDADVARAREAYERAAELRTLGRFTDAALYYDVVAFHLPRLADHMSLFKGDTLLLAENPQGALTAYRASLDSVDSTVRVLARIGRVRSLLAADHRDAEDALNGLMAKYPKLPHAAELRLAFAAMLDRQGSHNRAIEIYRRIDLREPGSPWASDARDALTAMAERGVRVRALSPVQNVLRAEALVSQGPHDMAKELTDRLIAEGTLRNTLMGRVYIAAARLARVEGRWADARRLLTQARTAGVPEEDAERVENRAQDMATAAMSREQSEVERRVRILRRGRPWGRVPTGALLQIVRVASRVGMQAEVNRALESLRRRSRTFPSQRLNAALWSVGVADDEHIVALLTTLLESPTRSTRLAARYHRARALHRLGQFDEAREQYERVTRDDNGITPFYKMWAQQHLIALTADQARCGGGGCSHENAPPATEVIEGVAERGTVPPSERPDTIRNSDAAALLAPIADEYETALPWIARAEDWLRLGERELAGEQLYEAFLGWRAARGRPVKRAGLESICRDGERAGFAPDWVTRRDRLELTREQRTTLSEVANALGDFGAATGFGGLSSITERPRAYARLVEAAAERHGLDPNLLFAIMRVESVYQRRIVSYAGAIGLTQIMPRTGRHIARVLGNERFTTEELLNPATNLDYSAWYLKSLIDRFDGHLPLAIASYNGGPHNVRRWLQDHSPEMPLDAFLEHIPFTQTHRYVRRVLTHYQAYRAQQDLPMAALSTRLPQVESDSVAF